MIARIYAQTDTTLYEGEPTKNTGLDGILDLSKKISNGVITNNRVIIEFNVQDFFQKYQRYISSEVNNIYSFLDTFDASEINLRLFTANVEEIPSNYKLMVAPLSESWDTGIGKYANKPITTYGASWYNRKNALTATPWTTGSYADYTTGSYTTNPGGGTWYFTDDYDYNYVVSESINQTSDIRLNVKPIFYNYMDSGWFDTPLPTISLIVKKTDDDEQSSDNYVSLKYFSSDSHTIYQPYLEIGWNDCYDYDELDYPDRSKQLAVYIQNMKKEYSEDSVPIFRVGVREKYPAITFATQSNYLENYILPPDSLLYSIVHADTGETAIPFHTYYTRVDNDINGNYFRFIMDSLHPERYYKILFKIIDENQSQSGELQGPYDQVIDNNHIFKITKGNSDGIYRNFVYHK